MYLKQEIKHLGCGKCDFNHEDTKKTRETVIPDACPAEARRAKGDDPGSIVNIHSLL